MVPSVEAFFSSVIPWITSNCPYVHLFTLKTPSACALFTQGVSPVMAPMGYCHSLLPIANRRSVRSSFVVHRGAWLSFLFRRHLAFACAALSSSSALVGPFGRTFLPCSATLLIGHSCPLASPYHCGLSLLSALMANHLFDPMDSGPSFHSFDSRQFNT